jgi:hypothetical protein
VGVRSSGYVCACELVCVKSKYLLFLQSSECEKFALECVKSACACEKCIRVSSYA